MLEKLRMLKYIVAVNNIEILVLTQVGQGDDGLEDDTNRGFSDAFSVEDITSIAYTQSRGEFGVNCPNALSEKRKKRKENGMVRMGK